MTTKKKRPSADELRAIRDRHEDLDICRGLPKNVVSEQVKAHLFGKCREMLDKARDEKRDLTGGEQAKYDTLFADAQAIDAELAASRDEAVEHRARRNGDRTPGLWLTAADGREYRALEPDESVLDQMRGGERGDVPATWMLAGGTGPMQRDECRLGKALLSLITGRRDHLSDAEARAIQSVGLTSDGGYLLNPTLSGMVIDATRAKSVSFRAGARTVMIDTGQLDIVRISQDPTASWKPESTAWSQTNMTLDRLSLRPKTLGAVMTLSKELAQDAANAAQVIEDTLRKVLAVELDRAILSGVGSGSEPLGIRNDGDVISTSTAASATTFADTVNQVRDVYKTGDYPFDVRDLSLVQNPLVTALMMNAVDTTGQPLQAPEWVRDLQKYQTTGIATTEGGSADESFQIVGDFRQILVCMKMNGVELELLREGTVGSDNAITKNLLHVRAVMRADVGILQPKWFSVANGI